MKLTPRTPGPARPRLSPNTPALDVLRPWTPTVVVEHPSTPLLKVGDGALLLSDPITPCLVTPRGGTKLAGSLPRPGVAARPKTIPVLPTIVASASASARRGS